METTRLSSKGQIVIPQAIRAAHEWLPGVEFAVIDTEEGILLTPIKAFKVTAMKDVLGCVGYKGGKKSLADMKKGIAKGARKRK